MSFRLIMRKKNPREKKKEKSDKVLKEHVMDI